MLAGSLCRKAEGEGKSGPAASRNAGTALSRRDFPMQVTNPPELTPAQAEAAGFRTFNECPHIAINIPDGGCTITTRDHAGKAVTFHFGVYREGGPPTFIDAQFHDSGSTVLDKAGKPAPIFDMLTISKGGAHHFDSRHLPHDKCPSIVCILLEPLTQLR